VEEVVRDKENHHYVNNIPGVIHEKFYASCKDLQSFLEAEIDNKQPQGYLIGFVLDV
jgi:hypothetical protein